MSWLEEQKLKIAGAALGLVMTGGGATYSVYQWHDNTYAHQDDVQQIEMRLEQKILNDRLNQIQQRMWRLEDRYGDSLNPKDNETAWEEYRQLKDERDRITRILEQPRSSYQQQGKQP